MNIKHTISILVENEFGALARIAGLFSGRGYNIETLSVAPTLDETLSRMTIVTTGSPQVIEQIIKQLNKLINVIKVQDITAENPINRILSLIKVNLGKKNQTKLKKILLPYGGEIIYQEEFTSVIQVVEEEDRIHELLEALKPYGIIEFVSTGNIAIQKGKKSFKG